MGPLAGIRVLQRAPRFGRTKPALPRPQEIPGAGTREALLEWGFAKADIDGLAAAKPLR